jgi:predicted phage tail protein
MEQRAKVKRAIKRMQGLSSPPVKTRDELRHRIVFHGELGKRFGREHIRTGRTVAECMVAVDQTRGGRLRQYLYGAEQRNVGFQVFVDGEEIPEQHLKVQKGIRANSRIEVYPVPIAGGGIVKTIVGVLMIGVGYVLLGTPFAPLGWGMIGMGLGLLASGVADLLAPGVPSISQSQIATGGDEEESKPGFGFSGPVNTVQTGHPVPVILGEVMAGSATISAGSQSKKWMSNDMLRRVVDFVSVGEIEGYAGADEEDSIYMNETKLSSQTPGKIKVEYRTGTLDQTVMTLVPSSENEFQVGSELIKGQSVARDTTLGSNIHSVRVNMAVIGLQRQGDGGISGDAMSWGIVVSDLGGTGWQTSKKVRVSGIHVSRRNVSNTFAVEGTGPWRVKVTKFTKDSSSTRQNRLAFSSITEIGALAQRYPGKAIFAMEWPASIFSGGVRRAYHLKGVKVRVPSNYDPVARTYTGDWDGTFKAEVAFNQNPVWLTIEYITNREWGLGNWIDDDDIEWFEWYRAAKRCDELVSDYDGGTKFRHSLNLQDTRRGEAWRKILELCSNMWAIPYWNGEKLGLMQDRPALPSDTITPDRVIDGQFIFTGSPIRSTNTRVGVFWNDPEDFYRRAATYQEDIPGRMKYGVRLREKQLVGVTSHPEAVAHALWLLRSELEGGESCKCKMGPEAGQYMPGQVVNLVIPERDPIVLATGLVAGGDVNTIALDKEVTLEPATTYTVVIPQPTYRQSDSLAESVTSIVLDHPLLNGDVAFCKVWQDWDGDGEYEVERVPLEYDSGTDTVTLKESGGTASTVDTRIEFRLPPGLRTINSPAGTTDQLSLSAPLLVDPQRHVNWVVYAPNSDPETWRVAGVSEKNEHEFELEFVKYVDEKYALIDAGVPVETPDPDIDTVPALGNAVPQVVGLNARLEMRPTALGLVPHIVIEWHNPDPNVHPGASEITGYLINYRVNNGPTQVANGAQPTPDSEWVLPNAEFGHYSFEVISYRWDGRKSSAATITYTYAVGGVALLSGRITGLSVAGGGATYTGNDIEVSWRYNDPNAPESWVQDALPYGVATYEVDVVDVTSSVVVRQVRGLQEPRIIYSNDMNRSDQQRIGNVEAARDVLFQVRARDIFQNATPDAILLARNPAPIITELVTKNAPKLIYAEMSGGNQDADFVGWDVVISTGPLNTADEIRSAKAIQGQHIRSTDGIATFNVGSGATYNVVAAAVDRFSSDPSVLTWTDSQSVVSGSSGALDTYVDFNTYGFTVVTSSPNAQIQLTDIGNGAPSFLANEHAGRLFRIQEQPNVKSDAAGQEFRITANTTGGLVTLAGAFDPDPDMALDYVGIFNHDLADGVGGALFVSNLTVDTFHVRRGAMTVGDDFNERTHIEAAYKNYLPHGLSANRYAFTYFTPILSGIHNYTGNGKIRVQWGAQGTPVNEFANPSTPSVLVLARELYGGVITESFTPRRSFDSGDGEGAAAAPPVWEQLNGTARPGQTQSWNTGTQRTADLEDVDSGHADWGTVGQPPGWSGTSYIKMSAGSGSGDYGTVWAIDDVEERVWSYGTTGNYEHVGESKHRVWVYCPAATTASFSASDGLRVHLYGTGTSQHVEHAFGTDDITADTWTEIEVDRSAGGAVSTAGLSAVDTWEPSGYQYQKHFGVEVVAGAGDIYFADYSTTLAKGQFGLIASDDLNMAPRTLVETSTDCYLQIAFPTSGIPETPGATGCAQVRRIRDNGTTWTRTVQGRYNNGSGSGPSAIGDISPLDRANNQKAGCQWTDTPQIGDGYSICKMIASTRAGSRGDHLFSVEDPGLPEGAYRYYLLGAWKERFPVSDGFGKRTMDGWADRTLALEEAKR